MPDVAELLESESLDPDDPDDPDDPEPESGVGLTAPPPPPPPQAARIKGNVKAEKTLSSRLKFPKTPKEEKLVLKSLGCISS